MFPSFLLACVWWLWAPTPALRAFQVSGYAQGTTYAITYYAADSLVTKQEIAQQLAAIDASLSLYQAGSLINQFNQAPRGVRPDAHLQRVVAKALQVYQDTDGLFDATVEPLVQAWGFGTRKTSASAPTPATIQALLRSVGSDKVHLRGDSLVKDVPGVHLDLNGIAQGYTVDVLAALLERRGIQSYLVELGGEIRVRGRKPGGELMRIGIERPDSSAFAAPALQQVIGLENGAVTTSGNYRKFRQVGATRRAHLIHPKTGYPFQNELISVTVVAPDALTADAYDNALMGMGLAKALQFVQQHPTLHAYFIYQRADGTVADTATPGFQRLRLPL